MTNDSKLDDLKNKASDLSEDIQHKAKEAKLQAEKSADDLKHNVDAAKLQGEKSFDDLKKSATDHFTEHKEKLDAKVDEIKGDLKDS